MKPKRFQLSVGALRAFSLALFACLQSSPVRAQDQSVSGNLTVSGSAQILGGVDIGSGANHTVDWDAPNFRVTGDINSIPGSFIWRDSYAVINSAALQGDRQNTLLIQNRAATFNVNGASRVRLYGHSMGNVVCSETLRLFGHVAAPVHTYVSAQGALSAHVWDNTTAPMPTSIFDSKPPDVYGHYWQAGASQWPQSWTTEKRPSYMDPQYMPTNTTFINHYNPKDKALEVWQIDQKVKPGVKYFYGKQRSDYPADSARFRRTDNAGATYDTILDFPNDCYEVFSYAAQSHSFATGAEEATGGCFNRDLSVNVTGYFLMPEELASGKEATERKYHGGQFRSTIQKRWDYWNHTMRQMQIEPNNIPPKR